MPIKWIKYTDFQNIPAGDLYSILKLRQDVFIIEQDCIYEDIDGFDQQSMHLLMKQDDILAGYSRIVPASAKYDEVSIGRIVVNPQFRGLGYGKEIVKKSLEWINQSSDAPNPLPVRIEAQAHLQQFYTNLGFEAAGDIYILDGIPHLEMLKIS
jgi:ElaA protein